MREGLARSALVVLGRSHQAQRRRTLHRARQNGLELAALEPPVGQHGVALARGESVESGRTCVTGDKPGR